MKKNKFQKILDQEHFEMFASQKLDTLVTSNTRGGDDPTSTALCKTVTTRTDSDSYGSQESLADSRCSGY